MNGGQKYGLMDRLMDGWTYRQMDDWMDGCERRWMDEYVDLSRGPCLNSYNFRATKGVEGLKLTSASTLIIAEHRLPSMSFGESR